MWRVKQVLTRCLLQRYCLRITSVFTMSIHGTQARAIRTSRHWITTYRDREKERNISFKCQVVSFATYTDEFTRYWCVYLSRVKWLVGGIVVTEEAHVDEGYKKTGGFFWNLGIICQPLVKNEQHQVAKQTDHEDDLRNKTQVDIQRFFEVPSHVDKQT